VFFLGIVPLILIDCVVILSEVMPAIIFGQEEYFILTGLIAWYLATMTVAMYPGREDEVDDFYAVQDDWAETES
jgi:hypothetical protein